MSNLLKQEKIDALVERFYGYLTKEAYFSSMFAERGVDIDQLKERQKVFISRMVNDDAPGIDQENAKQVKARHGFRTTPERAKIWLDLMEKAIDDMQFSPEIKELLMKKMNVLMDQIIEK